MNGFETPAARSTERVRRLDQRCIQDLGFPGIVLMELAGLRSADFVADLVGRLGWNEVLVLCGRGNNGGDGFVAARHLHNRGVAVRVRSPFQPEAFPDGSDAGAALRMARACRVPMEWGAEEPWAQETATTPPLVVDALLGTGAKGALRDPIRRWVTYLLEARFPVVSLDVPTGLDADTGRVEGPAVRALATLTFAAPKIGFGKEKGPEHTGRVHVIDISIPRFLYDE